jgi:glycosyltransferase involved in cell wall biosynthesis
MDFIKEYTEKYKDVEISGIDPILHYNKIGKHLGRKESILGFFKKLTKYFFIGHDATNTGAPRILLNIIRNTKKYDLENSILLLKRGGELVNEYNKYIRTIVIEEIISDKQDGDGESIIKNYIRVLDKKNKPKFILNTADVLLYLDILKDFKKYVLIHETVESVDLHFGGQISIDALANEADKIIFPTDSIRDNFIKRNKNIGKKSQTVPYGVNFKYNINEINRVSEVLRNELGIKKDKKIILGCGSIEHRKGTDLFIDTAVQVTKKLRESGHEEPLFLWVGPTGDREYKDYIDKKIQIDNINNIQFLGSVEYADKYFAASDLFILSSRMESLGMVALEALGYGADLFLFNNTSGVQSLLDENEYIGVKPFDIEGLASIVFERIQQMHQKKFNTAERIRKEYDAHDYSKKILAEIDKTEVLIIGYGPPPINGARVEGGGLRNWGLALGISKSIESCRVTLAFKFTLNDTIEEGLYNSINVIYWRDETIIDYIKNSDAVLFSYCMGSDTRQLLSYTTKNQLKILDCYVPIHIEVSSRDAADKNSELEGFLRDSLYWNESLLHGDIFLCASETQIEYYKGVLSAIGKINPVSYHNHGLRIVPYGINSDSPNPNKTPFSDLIKNDKNTFKMLWFGGVYPWFNVDILLEAISNIGRSKSIHLAMVGAKNPFVNNEIFVKKSNELINSIRKLCLTDIISLHDWVSYEDRGDWYCDCDCIITLNKQGIENSLSWRTRLVDYVWSGMPVLTNGGDPLGEDLILNGAAGRVSIDDSNKLARDIQNYITNPGKLSEMRTRMISYQSNLHWENIVKSIESDLVNI